MVALNPVTAAPLKDLNGIRHAFFTRQGGVSTGIYEGLNAGIGSKDDQAHIAENRSRMAGYLRVSTGKLATPYQVHSPNAVIAETAWDANRPEADAVVTKTPDLAVGVVTADCGPILFADETAGVVAAAHAGWKGALTGVLENTIEKMIELGAKRQSIKAVLGPTISQASYEVGPTFPEPFVQQNAGWSRYFIPSQKPEHHMFDLTGLIVDRLTNAGVRASAVERCTYCDENDFYSYRRTTHRQEPDYGRQLSAIMVSSD